MSKPTTFEIAQFVGAELGFDNTENGTRVVEDILAQAQEKRLLFHGIRKSANLITVVAHGVEPRSPEGPHPQNSYWTMGTRLFVADGLSTFDTTFFHYSRSNSASGNLAMNIAVADEASLLDAGIITDRIPFTDGELTIGATVPARLLSVMHCDVAPNPNVVPRLNGQLIEQAGLLALAKVVESY